MSPLRFALCCALLFPLFLRAEVVLNGWTVVDGQPLAVLRDTATRDTSPWLKIGQRWRGHTLVTLDTARGAATLQSDTGTTEIMQRYDVEPEVLISVRARIPADFTGKPYEDLVLKTPSATYRVEWTLGQLPPPVVLQPDREYEFTLIEHRSPGPQGDYVSHEFAQIRDLSHVLYDRDVCRLHNLRVTKSERPMPPGCVRPETLLELEISQRRARDAAPRSTAVSTDLPGSPRIYPSTYIYRSCPQCEAMSRPREKAGPNEGGR